jgi:hypothetical protein
MTLAETQALFHRAITEGDADPRAIEACFTGTAALPAAERLAIYAGMWTGRQVEALEAEFPALRACLGAERFAALCGAYLRRHPSRHHDIGRLGRHLPAFLREHPAPERADLGDLAALEWARSEAFFEAEASAVDREAMRALSPDDFARARLRFVPALRLLSLAHPAHEVWLRATRGEVPPPPEATPAWLAVWRTGHDVFHAALDRHEALALRAARAGASLLDVCARFAAVDEPVSAGFVALASWIDEGWVAAVERERVADD